MRIPTLTFSRKPFGPAFLAVAFCIAVLCGYYFAFASPQCAAGSCTAPLAVDSAGNLSIGTSSLPSTSRLYVIGSTTNSSFYGLSVRDLGGSPLLLVRNDGKVSIATSSFTTSTLRVLGRLELASSTGTTGGLTFPDGTTQVTAGGGQVSAANVAAGNFGSVAGIGNYSFPVSLVVSSTLGVGTSTAPTYTLQPVNANGSATVGIRNSSASGYPGIDYLDSGGTANLYIGYDNANGQTRINSTNNKPIRILTNSTDAIYVSSTQNIGIRTSNPLAKLTLSNNLATGALDTYSEYQQLFYDTGSSTTSYGIGIRSNTFVFNSNSAYNFDVNGVTKLTVAADGTVTLPTARITGVTTTASNDAATKGYVDNAFATSSIRWAGYSASAYTGNIGGTKAVINVCTTNYPGSVPASIDDYVRLGSQYPWTFDVWIFLQDNNATANSLLACQNYTSASGLDRGVVLSATAGTINADQQCSLSYRVGCVYKTWARAY